jgi:hypothetical protein
MAKKGVSNVSRFVVFGENNDSLQCLVGWNRFVKAERFEA